MIGETRLGDLKTRPDYAVSVHQALTGFIEIKAPGKGGDPRRYSGHDAEQWEKLQTLPNILYTVMLLLPLGLLPLIGLEFTAAIVPILALNFLADGGHTTRSLVNH